MLGEPWSPSEMSCASLTRASRHESAVVEPDPVPPARFGHAAAAHGHARRFSHGDARRGGDEGRVAGDGNTCGAGDGKSGGETVVPEESELVGAGGDVHRERAGAGAFGLATGRLGAARVVDPMDVGGVRGVGVMEANPVVRARAGDAAPAHRHCRSGRGDRPAGRKFGTAADDQAATTRVCTAARRHGLIETACDLVILRAGRRVRRRDREERSPSDDGE
jgi:hypothetical protein